MKNEHRRRDILKIASIALCGSTRWAKLATAAPEDEAGVHGMLVAGEHGVYLSHLPMFGPPHDYQVILEAAFTRSDGDPQQDYLRDRKRTGSTLYTLEPERFVLPRLNADIPLRSFKGNVYRGHFERFRTQAAKEAARIAQGVDVTVTRVIHFARFDPAAIKPARLEYLLFGKRDECFLAHIVTRAPDFDQIVPVRSLDHAFTDAELGHGVRVVIPNRPNSASGRIVGVELVTGETRGADGAAAVLRLKPDTEVYFEERELAS